MSFKNLFNDDSIFYDLIKSQLFNNINLNVNINLNAKKIVNVRELNKITLKSTRDNIYETNKELFTNEKKFGTIHRENHKKK